jgi:hypothetical protein
MAVLLSTILLIAKRNDQQKMQISRVTFMFQLIKVGEIHQFSLTICSFLAELCWLVLFKFVRLPFYLQMSEFWKGHAHMSSRGIPVYVEAQFK